MDFHLAEIVPDDSCERPSEIWNEVIRLGTERDLESFGYTDLVETDPELHATRYADQRYIIRVILLALPGSDPGGPRGQYGYRGVPARGPGGIKAGSLLGIATLEVGREDNTHLGEIADLLVTKGSRRRGIGTALLGASENLVRRLGGTTLALWAMSTAVTDQDHDIVIDPSGQVRLRTDDPAVRFALSHGYSFAQAERHNVQPLPVPAEVLIPALDASRATAAGYQIVSWCGATPAQDLDSMARLYEAMSTDVPAGEVDYRREIYDADRVRVAEEQMLRSGELFTTAARHVTSGTLVAFTQLQAPHNRPETVEQMYTGVLDGYRGHGLGLLLKATNCDLICRERPTSRRIHTFNADENDHMLAINTLLGYRAEGICVAWQKKLAESVG